MKTLLIKAQDLKKDFTTEEVVTKVLKGVSFEIEDGEFLAIMGPSGSGKSTLMHILGFLDRATEGSYLFRGEDVSSFDDDKLAELRSREAGFVFQSYNLLPRTTVFDNVMLPLIYSSKINPNERQERVTKVIKSVGLEHRTYHYSNQLSGGEQQRVAIARALVTDPTIIFADEPTGNLDSKSGQQVMQIIQDLNKQGRTIVLVTHEQDTAEHTKRIVLIKDGMIVSDKQVAKRRMARDGELKK